jgi:hypothetical protein
LWSAVQYSYEPRCGGLGYAVEVREGDDDAFYLFLQKQKIEAELHIYVEDSVHQGGARQGGVAAFKCGIVRWKVGFASGAMMVVIDVGRAARATAESTTSSQNVILAVRHVAAAASKTRKVDAGTTAGEGKSAPGAGITRGAIPSARSAQIRGAVSVHQDSLIH